MSISVAKFVDQSSIGGSTLILYQTIHLFCFLAGVSRRWPKFALGNSSRRRQEYIERPLCSDIDSTEEANDSKRIGLRAWSVRTRIVRTQHTASSGWPNEFHSGPRRSSVWWSNKSLNADNKMPKSLETCLYLGSKATKLPTAVASRFSHS
jgi:hypothetical protein